ncbi:Uncharacterized protein TPAR_04377 [Tolypocladium paradoxum]|uniref:Uncharacterized protein n=1 Tax=Tolypocladium paradoxum TaxID=94208 RepID=A0A2S4KZ17_9HYPO|nr:Uncharacterized protein TPAR_04377 [Tolypocladium paradoxum]
MPSTARQFTPTVDDAVITEMPALLTYTASLRAQKDLAGPVENDCALSGKALAVGDAETAVDYNLVIFLVLGILGVEIGFHLREKFPHYSELVRRVESKG